MSARLARAGGYLAIALLVAACGGGGGGTPEPTAGRATAPTDPARAAAERDCPRQYADACVPAYLDMAASGVEAALCVWPDYRWSFVTPAPGDAVGDYGCGTDGEGQIVAILGR